MLERPGLLLNPWAVRSTETGEQLAEGGEEFGAKGLPRPSEAAPGPATGLESAKRAIATGDFANLDFLADASAVVVNLVPDKDGMVRVARKAIGPHAMIHVVAVDPLNTTYRGTTLPERLAQFVDVRFRNELDPQGHFTQQKQVSVLPPGQPFVLEDVVVYGLYATLSKDPKLAEFAFLLTWPKLKLEEKRTLYSKYASHELHFFLAKKDPAFFQAVVLPYLANKKDKTFMDRWLLQEDLSEYRQPWWYGRLNTVERVLLAQRLQGEPAKTARFMNDLLRLQPPNIDRFLSLFDTAVKSGALETGDALGLVKQKLRAPENRPVPLMPMKEAPRAPMGGRGAKLGDIADSERKAAGARSAKQRDGRSAGKDEKKAEESQEGLGRRDEAAGFLLETRKKAAVRQLYRRLEPTMEWAENNYYQLLIQQQVTDLVPVSPFWLDYARYDGKGPFLSRHLADASRNFTEMVFALAVLDLPFGAGKHEVKFDAGRMTLTPAGPVLAFHEEVRPIAGAAGQTPILISQNFYRLGDRYREENGEKISSPASFLSPPSTAARWSSPTRRPPGKSCPC
jgi:hypothetical protein